MLRLGFNAYAKNVFHDHPSQISIISVLQARNTNWKTYLHKENKAQNIHACSSASLELTNRGEKRERRERKEKREKREKRENCKI